ncbi:carboxymuconolactone decarboxylase family protein [Bosea sp. 117]|uniref:carboxymuconolactone decarboxylase family protein n=1 Tax=Bosea sp. 117 TaxID=1125973 RepID=UPI0009DE70FD|nr:carboxymuconolactone decarboxylase family protein [Bosea sp. 117]
MKDQGNRPGAGGGGDDPAGAGPEALSTATDDRLARGKARLSQITGRSGEEVMAALADVAPDFARYIFEFGYGDIYSRPGLDLRTRMLATVAGLVCLGHAERELEVHIGSALNVGATREEVVEAIMQMALYAGFPAALDALFVAKRVFAERDTP